MKNATSIDAVIERIRAYAKAQGWPKSKLAKEAGLQDTTLRHFDRPGWSPNAATLRRLEIIIPPEFEAPKEAA